MNVNFDKAFDKVSETTQSVGKAIKSVPSKVGKLIGKGVSKLREKRGKISDQSNKMDSSREAVPAGREHAFKKQFGMSSADAVRKKIITPTELDVLNRSAKARRNVWEYPDALTITIGKHMSSKEVNMISKTWKKLEQAKVGKDSQAKESKASKNPSQHKISKNPTGPKIGAQRSKTLPKPNFGPPPPPPVSSEEEKASTVPKGILKKRVTSFDEINQSRELLKKSDKLKDDDYTEARREDQQTLDANQPNFNTDEERIASNRERVHDELKAQFAADKKELGVGPKENRKVRFAEDAKKADFKRKQPPTTGIQEKKTVATKTTEKPNKDNAYNPRRLPKLGQEFAPEWTKKK